MSNAYEVHKRVPQVLCCTWNIFAIHLVLLNHGIIVLHHIWQEGIHCYHSLCVCVRASLCVNCSVVFNPLWPHCLPGSSVLGILQTRILEWAAILFSRGSSHPGIKPGSPSLQADSLPSKLPVFRLWKNRIHRRPLEEHVFGSAFTTHRTKQISDRSWQSSTAWNGGLRKREGWSRMRTQVTSQNQRG